MTYPHDNGEGWEIPDFGLHVPVVAGDDRSLDDLYVPSGDAAVDDTSAPPQETPAENVAEGNIEPGRSAMPMFSITNPAGTVTATASITGSLHRIDLAGSRSATATTESELAQEILLVGRLAVQKARSELFTYLVDQTAQAGQDPVLAGRFLRDDVGLPTPGEAAAAQAEAFGADYLESHG